MKDIYKHIIIIACMPAYGYCVSIPDTVNLNEVSVISPKSITFSNGSKANSWLNKKSFSHEHVIMLI